MDEDFIQAQLHPMYASYYWEDREDNLKSEEQLDFEADIYVDNYLLEKGGVK